MTNRRKLTASEQKLKKLHENRDIFRLTAITQFLVAVTFLFLSTKRHAGLYVALAACAGLAGAIIFKRLTKATRFVESLQREAAKPQES